MNLGILFDSILKFEKHISAVVKSCFYQLHLLSKVKPFLSGKKILKPLYNLGLIIVTVL